MTTKKKADGKVWAEIEKSPERLKIRFLVSSFSRFLPYPYSPGNGSRLITMCSLATQEGGSMPKPSTTPKSGNTTASALRHSRSGQRTKPWA